MGHFAGRLQLVPPIAHRQRDLERVRTAGLRHERDGTAGHVAGLRARQRCGAGIREFEHGERDLWELDRREPDRRQLERRHLECRGLQRSVESLCRQFERQFVDGNGNGEFCKSERRGRRQEDTVEPEQFLVREPVGPKPVNPESIDEFLVDLRDELVIVGRWNVRSDEFTKPGHEPGERLGTIDRWHSSAEQSGERQSKRYREPDHPVRLGPIAAIHLGRGQFNNESQGERLVVGRRPESTACGSPRTRASFDTHAASDRRRGREQIHREVGECDHGSEFFVDSNGQRLDSHGGARRIERAGRGGDRDNADNGTRDRHAFGGSASFHCQFRRTAGRRYHGRWPDGSQRSGGRRFGRIKRGG